MNDYGVGLVPPALDYHFDAPRLTETIEDGGVVLYDWPIHMAEKTWVNSNAFNEASAKALEIHAGRYVPAADPDILAAGFAEVGKMKRHG